MERYKDADLPKINQKIRSWMEKSAVVGVIFKVVGVFGVALLLAGKSHIFLIWKYHCC
jgi:KUP system potassium uptake protein